MPSERVVLEWLLKRKQCPLATWSEESLRDLVTQCQLWSAAAMKVADHRRVVRFRARQLELDQAMVEAAEALGLGPPRAIPEDAGVEPANDDGDIPF